MAVMRCDFYSEVLEMSTSMTVVIPENHVARGEPPAPVDGLHPTLYLLHGLSDDDTTWLRRSSIERRASAAGLALVIPQVHRSYYSDEAHGFRYWTFLSQELPAIAGRLFRLSPRRELTFVAGISMGGYGAIKWALREPHRFAAAISLSGALGLAARLRIDEPTGQLDPRLWDRIFDNRPIAGTPDDPLWLLRDAAASGQPLPALWVGCGTDDPLYAENLAFLRLAEEVGVPVTRLLRPGGHTWDHWDADLDHVMAWLPLQAARVSVADGFPSSMGPQGRSRPVEPDDGAGSPRRGP